jgi:hypothetical protein
MKLKKAKRKGPTRSRPCSLRPQISLKKIKLKKAKRKEPTRK